MNKGNTVMLAVLVALGVTLVAGLIAIPTVENAHASLINSRINFFNDVRSSLICTIFGCSS